MFADVMMTFLCVFFIGFAVLQMIFGEGLGD